MPKVKIEAKKVLDDIRAGLDDATIMEKYNLSVQGFHSVVEKLVALKALNESYIWTGRPARDSGHHVGNRELSAKEVTRDIKSGMTDSQLMKKYKLTTKGLQHLLEQLMEAGLIKEDDLEIGKPLMENTVELTEDVLAPAQESVQAAKKSSDAVALPAPVPPQPPAAPALENKAPTPAHAATPRHSAPPKPDDDATQPIEPPIVPKKTQEVRLTDTAEPAFPSTVPITIVSDPPPPDTPPQRNAAAEQAPEIPTHQPQEPAQQTPLAKSRGEEPTQDLWTSTERLTVRIGEKSEEKAPPVESPPVPPPPSPVREQPISQEAAQPSEPAWKCPACGHAQQQAHDECPVCGIVVTKYLEHHKKSVEPEIKMPEKRPEPRIRPMPVREPHPPVVIEPVPEPALPSTPVSLTQPEAPADPLPVRSTELPPPPASAKEPEPPVMPSPKPLQSATQAKPEPAIKPRRKPARRQVVQEQPPEPPSEESGVLSGTLTGLAVLQLVLVLAYVGVQFVLDPKELASMNALALSCGVPILVSVVLAALLHAAAVLVRLAKEMRTESTKTAHELRSILTKLENNNE